MTRTVRRPHPFFNPRLGNLLVATVMVFGVSVWLLGFAPTDHDPTALLSGAWTTLTMGGTLCGFQALRRRRAGRLQNGRPSPG